METKAINTKLKGHARVDVADVLRGLAVMGIIILHSIEHFNFYSFPDTAGQSAWLNFSDKAIWNGLFFMFGGKAYAIFALLFGFSFFIQDDNQRLRGNDFRLRFCWRLILLFLIGNINASFFTAEVLVLYSLVGFILPLTCRLKDKWIFALACLLLIQPLPLYYVIRACLDPEFVTPAIPTRSFWNATFAVQSNGNFLETIRVNLWEGQLASLAWAWDHGRVFQTAALFLLGMLIGRKGLFLKEHLKVWNKVLAGSLVAFFPLYGLGNMLPDFITNKSILTPLSLIITSLSNFCIYADSGIRCRLRFLQDKLTRRINENNAIRKDEPYQLYYSKYSRFHVILQLGICIAQSVWYHSQLPGRNSFLHLAILFLPLVDESPLSRSDGIYMETGNLAEISQEPKSARICL